MAITFDIPHDLFQSVDLDDYLTDPVLRQEDLDTEHLLQVRSLDIEY